MAFHHVLINPQRERARVIKTSKDTRHRHSRLLGDIYTAHRLRDPRKLPNGSDSVFVISTIVLSRTDELLREELIKFYEFVEFVEKLQ